MSEQEDRYSEDEWRALLCAEQILAYIAKHGKFKAKTKRQRENLAHYADVLSNMEFKDRQKL